MIIKFFQKNLKVNALYLKQPSSTCHLQSLSEKLLPVSSSSQIVKWPKYGDTDLRNQIMSMSIMSGTPFILMADPMRDKTGHLPGQSLMVKRLSTKTQMFFVVTELEA